MAKKREITVVCNRPKDMYKFAKRLSTAMDIALKNNISNAENKTLNLHNK